MDEYNCAVFIGYESAMQRLASMMKNIRDIERVDPATIRVVVMEDVE